MPNVRTYLYLEPRPDKSSQELFIRGTRIRPSDILRDKVAWEQTEEEIAADRDLPIEVVREALAYCEENAELLERERQEDVRLCEEIGSRPIYPRR
jgi:uncharacterized protein (DUF433 family)